MRTDTLTPDLCATHDALARRLEIAAGSRAVSDAHHPRAERPSIDTFLNATSRHNAAVLQVVLPAVRSRLPDGHASGRALVDQCRRLELALNQVKAKVYGSTYAVGLSWDGLWDHVRREFAELARLEQELSLRLAEAAQDPSPDWPHLLHDAELAAPTRPHPWIPHQGVPGRAARAVARRIDAFWDNAEGRMLPAVADHRDRPREGNFTRFLLADPHLEPEAGFEAPQPPDATGR